MCKETQKKNIAKQKSKKKNKEDGIHPYSKTTMILSLSFAIIVAFRPPALENQTLRGYAIEGDTKPIEVEYDATLIVMKERLALIFDNFSPLTVSTREWQLPSYFQRSDLTLVREMREVEFSPQRPKNDATACGLFLYFIGVIAFLVILVEMFFGRINFHMAQDKPEENVCVSEVADKRKALPGRMVRGKALLHVSPSRGDRRKCYKTHEEYHV